MMRIAFGVFLILHGLIHASWLTPRPADPSYPFDLTHSRLFPTASAGPLRAIGLVLVIFTVAAFIVAGLGVLGIGGIAAVWRVAAIAGAVASLLTIAVFWHPWFAAGPALDVAIIAAAFLNWP